MGCLFEQYRAFIIDLDGVIYLMHETVQGSSDAVRRMQELGLPFVFVTNNSVATPGMYVERLKGHGIEVGPESIVSSAQAVRHFLERRGDVRGKTALVIGEEGLRTELEALGLRLLEAPRETADLVVVGWDRTFDFEKLKSAVVCIRAGAEYLATNADATYPTPQGLWPGAGTMVAAVSTGAGREPVVAGKPNPIIVELALERLGSRPEETLIVGDRLDSDIAAGEAVGVDTMLVLTGVSKREEVDSSPFTPTHVAPDLASLMCL